MRIVCFMLCFQCSLVFSAHFKITHIHRTVYDESISMLLKSSGAEEVGQYHVHLNLTCFYPYPHVKFFCSRECRVDYHTEEVGHASSIM